jgi:hypothetical protein
LPRHIVETLNTQRAGSVVVDAAAVVAVVDIESAVSEPNVASAAATGRARTAVALVARTRSVLNRRWKFI